MGIYNLKFDCKEHRSDRGYVESAVFTIAAEVPGLIVFSADLERSRIKLYIKNLETLGDISYEYDIDEVNPEFLEELSKYILVKPNKFRTMGKYRQPFHSTRNTNYSTGSSAAN